MTPWTKLSKEERLTILTNIAEEKGIVENAIEKDYWVSMVLRSIFSLPYADALVFKGGTSLSKGWYQHENWDTLLTLWKYYNLHICQVIRSVDETKLQNYWLDYEGNRITLRDMIIGYTGHLNLHLEQIHELIEQ